MKQHFKPGFKCIILVRDLMEVFASYIKWYTENPDAFPNKLGKNNEEKLFKLMNEEGAIVKGIKSIRNASNYPKMCHVVKYNNIIINPEKEFKKIYKFLGEPYFNHKFNNLNQVSINGLSYDDKIVGNNMHKLFDGPIRKIYNPYIEKIPKKIKQKYEHIKF